MIEMKRSHHNEMPKKAKKNTACSACFESRQKCVRRTGASSCDRCLLKQKPCVKRVPKPPVRRKSAEKDSCRWLEIAQAVGALVNHERDLKVIDRACSTLVKQLPQDILASLANFFGMRAFATRNLPSLHAATSLGLKAGCTVAAIDGKTRQVIPNESLRAITDHYHHLWFATTSNPAMIAITVMGTETVYANETFKRHFSVPEEDVACKAWCELFADAAVVKRFQTDCFKTWLSAPRTKVLNYDAFEYKFGTNTNDDSERVDLIGKSGERISAHATFRKAWVLPGEIFVNFLEIESLPEQMPQMPAMKNSTSMHESIIETCDDRRIQREEMHPVPRDDEFAAFLIDAFPRVDI